ncbi:MAG: hypothetical protein JXA30_12545, partial [Deltaproteobacteria bacterium]|nr:hypothetical protein [Deltaproteobacteria bacterium]
MNVRIDSSNEVKSSPRNVKREVSVQGGKQVGGQFAVKPSAPAGPARMVLAVPDEPARGRKPVLR